MEIKYRNDYRKNVVFCGFNEIERKSIIITDASEVTYEYNSTTLYRKCPHVIYLDTLEEAIKHKGLELFLKVNEDINFIEFDKKYRKKLDYWYINIYNENFKDDNISKYSNINIINETYMYQDHNYDWEWKIDEYFKKHQTLKIHPARKELLDKIHNYIKKNKEVSSNQLKNVFDLSIRNIQRYMNDINLLYNDIGYDYSKNIWYICK